MADKDEERTSKSSPLKMSPIILSPSSLRPTISLPARSSMESMFVNDGPIMGFSPGPMTLVSNFFSENDPDSDCRSFSQLLAGAITSPTTTSAVEGKTGISGDGGGDFRFEQNRSSESMFMLSPGISPACLLESPVFFSSAQGSFGTSRQQALAHVSSHAEQTHPQMHLQAEYPSSVSSQPASSLTHFQSITAHANTRQQMPPLAPDHNKIMMQESSKNSYSDQRSQSSTITADKPADDGYNWRKYGQKQVKGSDFPRSYYKCTHAQCPMTKKVERSLDGHVTEIIYKGQHNHEPPQSNKRGKNHGNTSSQVQTVNPNKLKDGYMFKKEQESSQASAEHVSGSSDSEEVGGVETRDDEPDPKRRNTEVRVSEQASSRNTVTEPRIIVQTTSEVDLLDDGYRWRKYGQKVVKGNPYPRSYYKCTTPACNVRKHVERAASDPKAVITTYEGKHNHDLPAARNSSHNTANNNIASSQARPNGTNSGNYDQQPIAVLRLKEEQIT